MYQAFKAVVTNGKIQPLEKIKLKESTPLLVTVVDQNDSPKEEWSRLQKWIQKQKRSELPRPSGRGFNYHALRA